MLNRLFENLGHLGAADDAAQLNNRETQLAVAVLLYAVVPADHVLHPLETSSLYLGLKRVFSLNDRHLRKLISRAIAMHQTQPGLFAPATLVKHRHSLSFRKCVEAVAKEIAEADGSVHRNESDVLRRIHVLLGMEQVITKH